MASRPGGVSGRTTSLSGSGTESSSRRLRSDMPGQGYARLGAIRVVEVCCKESMIVDVTESLTVVTTRNAATPPAGRSGGSPHSGSRWAGTPRSRGAGGRAAPRIRGAGGRQLPAFDARLKKQGPPKRPRALRSKPQGVQPRFLLQRPAESRTGAHSLRGKPAEPLPPNSSEKTVSNPKSVQFSDPVSVHFSNPIDGGNSPHSWSRRRSATRIRGPGWPQLSAFG